MSRQEAVDYYREKDERYKLELIEGSAGGCGDFLL